MCCCQSKSQLQSVQCLHSYLSIHTSTHDIIVTDLYLTHKCCMSPFYIPVNKPVPSKYWPSIVCQGRNISTLGQAPDMACEVMVSRHKTTLWFAGCTLTLLWSASVTLHTLKSRSHGFKAKFFAVEMAVLATTYSRQRTKSS